MILRTQHADPELTSVDFDETLASMGTRTGFKGLSGLADIHLLLMLLSNIHSCSRTDFAAQFARVLELTW